MEYHSSDSSNANPGLMVGLGAMAKNLFGLVLSRIELAALELSEVRTTLLKLALVFGIGIAAAWFALAYWTALIVFLTWETLGWKILLIIAVAFTLLVAAIYLYARALLLQGKLSIPATMAELRNDRDA